MARKGWDALSDAYRARLQGNGITESAYESGASLHKARGHTSQAQESFTRRVDRFVQNFGTTEDTEEQRQNIRDMGTGQGQAYMDYRRQMTRTYERGDYKKAQALYAKRDRSVPDSMWWYHGMFGG
jgi:hypothetical protein